MKRLSSEDRAAIVFTVSTVLLVVLGLLYDPPAKPILTPATTRTSDSLTVTAPAFHAAIDTAAERRRIRDLELLELRRRMVAARAAADREQRRADSAAAVAQTAMEWRAAYELRFREAVQLRNELADAGATIARLETDTASLRVDLRAALQRVSAFEDFQARVARDVAAANKRMECTLVSWPVRVRCPTRRESAVGGAITGLVAGVALRD